MSDASLVVVGRERRSCLISPRKAGAIAPGSGSGDHGAGCGRALGRVWQVPGEGVAGPGGCGRSREDVAGPWERVRQGLGEGVAGSREGCGGQ